MRITGRLNNAHIRTSCVACGVSDKPGGVAYFDEDGGWVCDVCVEAGPDAIRASLTEQAERHRRAAAAYDEAARAEIVVVPDSDDVIRERANMEAWAAREKMRADNSAFEHDDVLPF